MGTRPRVAGVANAASPAAHSSLACAPPRVGCHRPMSTGGSGNFFSRGLTQLSEVVYELLTLVVASVTYSHSTAASPGPRSPEIHSELVKTTF